MRDAVIVEAVRTALGKRNGSLAGTHPVDLSATILRELIKRTGIEAGSVDDVIWGCVTQSGDQAANIARNGILAAGWPAEVPGTTVDRQCGSSQQAVSFAAASVIAGQYEVVVAGGVESMSRVPMGASALPGLPYSVPSVLARYGVNEFNQGTAAEMIAARWEITRSCCDEFAIESHAKAAEAIDAGSFAAQIVAIEPRGGSKFETDEGVRRGSTLERLGQLATPFDEHGVITAASSAQISDGAAGLMIMTSAKAAELGMSPIARIHTCVVVGDDPVLMLTGPIAATRKVLDRAGLTLADIGAFEVNEAFASVPIAWLSETGANSALLNPNGGSIALGHPLGASGARLMTTLVHHLRDDRIQYGMQVMCEGGGMANATILELL